MEERIIKKYKYPVWAKNETIIATDYGWERVMRNGKTEILVAYKNLKTILENEKNNEELLKTELEDYEKLKKYSINATIVTKKYRKGKNTIFNLSIGFSKAIEIDISKGKPKLKVIKEEENGDTSEIVLELFTIKSDPEIMNTYNLKFKLLCDTKEICKFIIKEDAFDIADSVIKDEENIVERVILEQKILIKEINQDEKGIFGVRVV